MSIVGHLNHWPNARFTWSIASGLAFLCDGNYTAASQKRRMTNHQSVVLVPRLRTPPCKLIGE